MLQGEFVGKLNIENFFKTLARLVGEEHGVEITVTSIKKKADAVVEKANVV